MKRILSVVETLSLSVWNSTFYRHLLFFVASFFVIGSMGYYFGSFDQVVHIPFLKKFADPSLFPNDYFLDLRQYHYSFFWFFFIPLYRAGILEISMFIIYGIAIYLTFWALWGLSKTLFNNPVTSFLTVLTFSMPHLSFAAFPIFEFSLLNRTFVLPFLLIAINLYLKKKYIFSFLILGLMYNLHVISVNFVLFFFIFDSIIRIKRIGVRRLLVHLIFFIIAALPVLIWKFNSTPVGFAADWNWFLTMSNGMLEHLFYFNSQFYLSLLTLGGISLLILFFIAKRNISNQFNSVITNFIYAAIVVLCAVYITSTFYPSVIIIQSQIIRVGLYVLLFSYLYFIEYSVKLVKNNKISLFYFSILLIALIFSLSPLILLSIWLVLKFIRSKYAYLISIILLGGFLSFIFYLILKLGLWKPEIHIFPTQGALYDVELWAKNNTQKDAIFITPPHGWWLYSPEWRVVAERSTVVTLYDLLEIAFAPDYINLWKNRFQDIAPGAMEKFNGNVFENFKITKQAYYSLTTNDFKRLAKKYNVSYLLVEKQYTYDLPVVYNNNHYTLYKLNPSF